MQSCNVVDPVDNKKLLFIINVAAASHENLELVELVPVPFFTNDRANFPVLQSEFIALNQLSMVYRELSPIEAEACMTGQCYITSMAKFVGSLGCGNAQYYAKYVNFVNVVWLALVRIWCILGEDGGGSPLFCFFATMARNWPKFVARSKLGI